MSKLSATGFTLVLCAAALGLVAVLLRAQASAGWRDWWVGAWAPREEFTPKGWDFAVGARVLHLLAGFRVRLLVGGTVLLLAVFVLLARRRGSPAPQLALPGEPLDDAVPLAVRETSLAGATERTFEAEYRGGGEVARFGFSFVPKPVPADGPAAFTTGRVSSRAGSHTSGLMFALAQAHGARAGKVNASRRSALDVDVGFFGDKLHRGAGAGSVIAGAFSSEPLGSWIVVKLFVPTDGDEPGELFLALNPEHGEGLFLVKDPEYWGLLENPLWSVL
jgi:hypothetical protein